MWDAPNQLEELQAQLTGLKFEYTRKGQVKVESKDALALAIRCGAPIFVEYTILSLVGFRAEEKGESESEAAIPTSEIDAADEEAGA